MIRIKVELSILPDYEIQKLEVSSVVTERQTRQGVYSEHCDIIEQECELLISNQKTESRGHFRPDKASIVNTKGRLETWKSRT